MKVINYLLLIFLVSCGSKVEFAFEQLQEAITESTEGNERPTWLGLEDNNFLNINNWKNKKTPNKESNVLISKDCISCNFSLSSDIEVASLEFEEEYTGTIDLNGHDLTINERLKTTSSTTFIGKCSQMNYGTHEPALAIMSYGEVTPDISISDTSSSEGNDLVFTVTLSESTCAKDVTLNLSLANETAMLTDDDYNSLVTSNLTIPAGSTTTSVVISTIEDTKIEPDETLVLTIDSVDGANITSNTATGTIVNNDAVPVLTPSISGSVIEGSNATITFTLSYVASTDVSFDWSVAAQTASIPQDLQSQSGSSVTIPAGETTTTISVATINDNPLSDGGETFGINVTNLIGATLDPVDFSVTLSDGAALALNVDPNTITINQDAKWQIKGLGGTPPYTYAITSGAGSISPSGLYTAPSSATTAVVEVTDNVGAKVQSTITVNSNYSTAGGCSGFAFYSTDVGNLKDEGGDSDYAPNLNCRSYISSDSYQNITLTFNTLSLGTGDTLSIHNPSDGSVIASYDSNSPTPSPLDTGTDVIYLDFSSDATNESSGFDIDWFADSQTLKVFTSYPSETIEAGGWSYNFDIIGGVGPYSIDIISGNGSVKISDTQPDVIQFTTSMIAETVTLQVTDIEGSTDTMDINVSKTAFAVNSISKTLGSPGETIYIYGDGFLPNTSVFFNSTTCDNIVVLSSTRIFCNIPSGSGVKDVTASINHPLKTASETLEDVFTYIPGTWNNFSSQPPASAARMAAVSAWTGEKYIIWGGGNGSGGWGPGKYNDGYIYDKLTDSWSTLAVGPITRNKYNAVYVWTGHELITAYGLDQSNEARPQGQAYNPSTNTWRRIADAPGGFIHDRRSVWTGEEMIVLGGVWNNVLNNVQAYNPVTDTWRTLAGMPDKRYRFDVVFTGRKIIVQGGQNTKSSGNTTSGFSYDIFTNTWTTIATAPLRSTFTQDNVQTNNYMMWSGDRLIFTGAWGSGSGDKTGIYNPYTDTWETMTQPPFSPYGQARLIHTGSHILYHLGSRNYSYNIEDDSWLRLTSPGTFNSGSASYEYDGSDAILCFGTSKTSNFCERLELQDLNNPLSNQSDNSFEDLGSTNEPSQRKGHSLTWSGKHAIVFGGRDSSGVTNSGKKYNPFSKVWTDITSTNAPTSRENHSALWTGDGLFVFGGLDSSGNSLNTGAIYSPALDTWTTLPTLNAPSARKNFAIAKTNKYVLIWGGENDSGVDQTDGAIFNLESMTWSSVSQVTPPSSGSGVMAVNIARNKIAVFGGSSNTGGILDLPSNTWTTMSTTDAPTARHGHALAYAKGRVIVYGGEDGSGVVDDLKTYDVQTDTWTDHANTLGARKSHTYQVTDNKLFIFGGIDDSGDYVNQFKALNLHDFTTENLTTDVSVMSGVRNSAWIGSIGDRNFGHRNNHSGDSIGLILWGGTNDGTSLISNGVIYKPETY